MRPLVHYFHVRGAVLVSDNKPIADGMSVALSSATVWDYQTVLLAADGHFEFTNLPAGKYTISASVKGYHEKTPQYDPTPFSIVHDIDNFTTTIYPNIPQAGGAQVPPKSAFSTTSVF